MKTKPFLLATAGSTVDGRVIDDGMLKEMASSYDPKTYGARLNIEHLRGISPDKPFHAYGDVLELSTGEVEVDFNGKKEKRLGLYGVFDVMDNAKQLNDAGQKVYPSIEINPNFGGKGFAYLMGCALTDSPASIATERLTFNRAQPGNITGYAQDFSIGEAVLELEEAAPSIAPEVGGMFKSLAGLFDRFSPAPEVKPEPKVENPAPADFAAQLKPLFEGMATALDTSLATMAAATTKQVEAVSAEVTALKAQVEATADPNHHSRPKGTGGNTTDLSRVF